MVYTVFVVKKKQTVPFYLVTLKQCRDSRACLQLWLENFGRHLKQAKAFDFITRGIFCMPGNVDDTHIAHRQLYRNDHRQQDKQKWKHFKICRKH